MKKNMHTKTMAIVLATTTVLQSTGVVSKLIDGDAFVTAYADTGNSSSGNNNNSTTGPAVTLSLPEKEYLTVYNDTTTPGAIKLTWESANEAGVSQSDLKYYLYFSQDQYYNSIDDWEDNAELLNPNDTSNINEWTFPYSFNNESTYYFQLIVEDPQGHRKAYATESYSRAIKKVSFMRNGTNLQALLLDSHNNEANIDESKVTYNWSIDGVTVGTEKNLTLLSSYENKTIVLKVNIEGYSHTYTGEYIPTVDRIQLIRDTNIVNVDALDFYGNRVDGTDFTFDYEWSIDGQVISTNKSLDLTNYYGKNIQLKVTVNHTHTFNINATFINVDGATATISGVPQNGQTLKAVVNDKAQALNLKYEWWRIDDQKADSLSDEIQKGKAVKVSDAQQYTITGNDLGHYLRLLVYYKDGDGVYRAIHPIYTTNEIVERASSSSSHHHSSSSSSSSASSTSSSSNTNASTGTTNSNSPSNSNATQGTETSKIEKNDNGQMKIVNGDGQAATGWQQVDGHWYLADSNGVPKTGWQQTNGNWYLLNTDGTMATGWQQAGGQWFLLNNNGSMATGWQKVNGSWYLLNDNGTMSTGWQKVDGKWYYLNSDGTMASNTTVDGYTLDENGALVE